MKKASRAELKTVPSFILIRAVHFFFTGVLHEKLSKSYHLYSISLVVLSPLRKIADKYCKYMVSVSDVGERGY